MATDGFHSDELYWPITTSLISLLQNKLQRSRCFTRVLSIDCLAQWHRSVSGPSVTTMHNNAMTPYNLTTVVSRHTRGTCKPTLGSANLSSQKTRKLLLWTRSPANHKLLSLLQPASTWCRSANELSGGKALQRGPLIGKWFIVKRASASETGAPLTENVGICKLSPVEGLCYCTSQMDSRRSETFVRFSAWRR